MSELELIVYEVEKRKKKSEEWEIDAYRPWIYKDGKNLIMK